MKLPTVILTSGKPAAKIADLEPYRESSGKECTVGEPALPDPPCSIAMWRHSSSNHRVPVCHLSITLSVT